MAQQSGTRQSATIRRGIVPLLIFAALTAAMDVYGSNRLQVVSPESLTAVSFTLTAVFFLVLELARNGTAFLTMLRESRHDVIAINITTAVTWLATFYALRNLEPAVVNVVGLALGPVFILLTGAILRRGASVIAAEVVVALGICVFLSVLVWGSFTGETAVGDIGESTAAWGLVFSVVCAIGSAANITYMKRLSDRGRSPQEVLAVRFFLMIAIGWAMTATSSLEEVTAALVPGAVVAVIGIGLPIYVLQIGIRHTEPITTALIVSLSPIFAYFMQFLDGRLQPSSLTIVGIVGIVALATAGTLARARHDSRLEAATMPSAYDTVGDRR